MVRLLALALVLPVPASAVTLTLASEETPYPGVTLQEYTTTSPETNTFVVRVDLCAADLHVEATAATTSLQTAGSWAEDQGLQVAINGDFYATSPTRVYGHAVGSGVAWPLDQTGRDPAYASEWYFDKYGSVAFGHDWVDFTHTEQVKNEASTYGLTEGYALTELGPAAPAGTLSLVSGFPELVIEGTPVDCVSPTDSSCFPDRTDMRSRHPRSALGLTEDRQELIVVAVDGRTSASDGMYGEELADLMGQLGAYVAFNLDGGGSTQLWLEDRGYVNDASGNNSGGGVRSVANHLGIRAGATGGGPSRPGHCASEPACALLGVGGGVIDDDSTCFRTFGNPVYWREEATGHGGRLFWTNAWNTDLPENWAWWQVELEESGDYDVEVWVDPTFGVFDAARYEVVAADATYDVVLDQSAGSGWVTLGTFPFAAGGVQHVAVFDDHDGSVPSDQHVAADALRLTRVGPYCGDGVCDPGEDAAACPMDCDATTPGTEPPVDTGTPTDTGTGWVHTDPTADTGTPGGPHDDPEDLDLGTTATNTVGAGSAGTPEPKGGCATAVAPPTAALWLVGLSALGWRRRSR